MIEFLKINTPPTDEHLTWLAELYGPVDPKYASLDFVRHQFRNNPFGWSALVFALDDGEPIAHCGAVPFCARMAGGELLAGKIEAVVVAESHRGRRTESGASLAVEMLSTMYAFAHESGIEILFGLAPPRVSAIHARAGCERVTAHAPTFVLFTHPRAAAREWSRRGRVLAACVGAAQNAVGMLAYGMARVAAGAWRTPVLGPPTPSDAPLGEIRVGDGAWTVAGGDAWDWYTGSGVLQALEIGGRFGGRAILRVGAPGSSLQVVAWRPRRAGALSATLLLGASRRLARRRGAPTLRYQPWPAPAGDGRLQRTARLLGFARRSSTELVVHTNDADLRALEIVVTPFFYATF